MIFSRTIGAAIRAGYWFLWVRLSRTSIADEMREEHRRRVLGE